MKQHPTVLLVEDQQPLRMSLRCALEQSNACDIIGEADDGRFAVQEALRLRPQVVLMDIGLPGLDGIEATRRIKSELPHTRIIIFTSKADADLVSGAFGAGADGYCTKEAPVSQIVSAIECVLQGQLYLEPFLANSVLHQQKGAESNSVELNEKELQLLALIGDTNSTEDIASQQNTSSQEVVDDIKRMLSKFVTRKTTPEKPEQTEKAKLSEWFTAFKRNLDKDDVFDEKYLIHSLIGTGGIGTVYKAEHLYIDRTVAIKMLHSDLLENKTLMRTFQREGKAAASLQHKNIVGIYDFEISDDHQPYLVMEYIDGLDLNEVIAAEGKLDCSRALCLLIQVCDALAAAHERGVIHCDLKPSNILITSSGHDELVKLVDFGLVQILPQGSSKQLRSTDGYCVSGTPTYMSPEQCLGKSLDERSDIYSLGCVMFEVLTRKPVFTANSAMQVFTHHLNTVAPTLHSVCPDVNFGGELESIVASTLEKEPGMRPQTIHEIRSRLISAFLILKGHSKIELSEAV